MSDLRTEIAQTNPEALLADGLDEAIMGIGNQHGSTPVVIYDYDRCVSVFMRDNQWDCEEALEWMEYNVANAYMGTGTPIFLKRVFNEEV